MKKDLPIYDIVLSDDNQGVGMISLVDDPAIQVNWIKLANQPQELFFKTDVDKQMLYGPFLIPNKLIYRFDEINGEYYVRFKKEQIEEIASKFNEDLNNKNINFMHTDEKVDAFVSQNWIIENEQDKSKSLGFDLPEGTWFGGVKVKDSNFWTNKVKNEEVKGFSVEILADLELSLKNKEQIMKKQIKLSSAVLKNGTTVYFDGDLAVGTAVYLDEALTEKAPDADHVAEDGTIVVTVDGIITEIRPVEEMAGEKYLSEDGPCYEGYVQVGMKMVDGKEVPNCVPNEDGRIAESTMAIDPNTGSELPAQITPEEVSMMIDNRFGELMEEITRLKIMIEGGEKEIEEFKKQVNEKFSTTPAKPSIKKQEVRIDEKFSSMEARVKAFAKNK
jgi:hypothetical protein